MIPGRRFRRRPVGYRGNVHLAAGSALIGLGTMTSRRFFLLALGTISWPRLATGAERPADPSGGRGAGKPARSKPDTVGEVRRHAQYRGCNLVGGGAQVPWTEWAGADLPARIPGEGPKTTMNYEY